MNTPNQWGGSPFGGPPPNPVPYQGSWLPNQGIPLFQSNYGSVGQPHGGPSKLWALWPTVSVIVAACGVALAFAPPPAGWVGGAAGVLGLAAAIVGWLRQTPDRSLTPVLPGIGLSIVAVVAVVAMSFVYGGTDTSALSAKSDTGTTVDGSRVDSRTAAVLRDDLSVKIGSFESGVGLKITVTNKRGRAALLALAVGAFEGDSNNQIEGSSALFHLAGGATQEMTMFERPHNGKDVAARLPGATFRVTGAASTYDGRPPWQ